ncbi:MAG: biopolymer transporter ExbD [Planctomycetota bacterium]|nr:biopolymer transporter ExbD [Planctomycetota bacterium]MDA1177664.1 biopolymer transporter ExbD [Planctomycetota bacterium]
MRFRSPEIPDAEVDWTPMIDVTFQLISFFMFVINFTVAEVDQRVQLPSSPLAKPSEEVWEFPIFLHLTTSGTVVAGGAELALDEVKRFLLRETELLRYQDKSPDQANVIIRADSATPMELVQQLIQTCRDAKLENFHLRAKEEKSTRGNSPLGQ